MGLRNAEASMRNRASPWGTPWRTPLEGSSEPVLFCVRQSRIPSRRYTFGVLSYYFRPTFLTLRFAPFLSRGTTSGRPGLPAKVREPCGGLVLLGDPTVEAAEPLVILPPGLETLGFGGPVEPLDGLLPRGIGLVNVGNGAGQRPVAAFDQRTYGAVGVDAGLRSEEHTSELQSRQYLVCRLLLDKKHSLLCCP